MNRITFAQVRASDFPQAVQMCANDIPQLTRRANRCQEILINCGGETGWVGGWAKVVFNVSRTNPFITLPREFARAINLDVCNRPIRVQNEFYEFLDAGIGLRPGTRCTPWCGLLQGYERGHFPTMVDLVGNQFVRAYITDVRDVGKRILVDALDQNGNRIYSTDVLNQVSGFYLTLDQPFVTSTFEISSIRSIQKDITFGDVLLNAVDAITGAETLLSRYAPDEVNPSYPRYYIDAPPNSCCESTTPGIVQVSALAKYDYIPVARDTDFMLINSIPALIEEAKAIRFADMDVVESINFESKNHRRAIKLLQDQMRNYLGEVSVAVNFAPFGNARYEHQMIGSLI